MLALPVALDSGTMLGFAQFVLAKRIAKTPQPIHLALV